MWKLYLILLVFIIPITSLLAQPSVKIASGTVLKQNGNVNIVITNADLIVDGELQQGNAASELTFRGDLNQKIIASDVLALQKLTINKVLGSEVLMTGGISISSNVNLLSGRLNLGANVLDLLSGAVLLNESETSHVTGESGGYIQTELNLVSPISINPGNLGAMISSTSNLGNTIVRRGHTPQAAGSSIGINRYYDILPSNNSGLDAELRFYYLDYELNGISEGGAELGRSTDNVNWVNESENIVYDPMQNFIQKSGIPSFSRWTIFGEGALPVELLRFEGKLNDAGRSLLSWVTVSESDFSHFDLESGSDAKNFSWLATINGKGTETSVTNYEYQDNQPLTETRYFRLKMVDKDGSYHFSNIVSIVPNGKSRLHYYPNPVQNLLKLESSFPVKVIDIYNSSGVLIKTLNSETEIRQIFMEQMPGGLYMMKINGKEVIKVIKQ
jgi:hypothetical protein